MNCRLEITTSDLTNWWFYAPDFIPCRRKTCDLTKYWYKRAFSLIESLLHLYISSAAYTHAHTNTHTHTHTHTHYFLFFSIVVYCFQLLSIVFNCCLLFSIVVYCFQLLSIVFNCCLLFSIVVYCFQLFSIVFNCCLLFSKGGGEIEGTKIKGAKIEGSQNLKGGGGGGRYVGKQLSYILVIIIFTFKKILIWMFSLTIWFHF